MSDLSITAANVLPGTDAAMKHGWAGETITAGQTVYKKASDGKYYKADNNAGTSEARTPKGVALNGASAGQPITIQESGDITIGATLTAGTAYFQSGTAGGICAAADLTTGMYPTSLGIAKSTTVLDLNITASGVSL